MAKKKNAYVGNNVIDISDDVLSEYEALQSAATEPVATKSADPSMWEYAKSGFNQTVNAVKAAYTDDEAELAKLAVANQQSAVPQTAAQLRMAAEIKPYADAAAAEDSGIGEWAALFAKRAVQLASNPKEFAGMVVQNLPNSAPGLAGTFAGGAIGGQVGPVGGVIGGLIGGTAGGYDVEQGSSKLEQIVSGAKAAGINPSDEVALADFIAKNYSDILEKARLKGIGTAGTDAALNVATMGVSGIGRRAMAKEALALEQAVKTGAITTAEAAEKRVALEAANKAYNTLGRKTARGAALTASEMGGESLSEATGQKLAYGKVEPLEVVDEGLIGLGHGPAMAAGEKTFSKLTGLEHSDPIESTLGRIQNVLGARSVDEAAAQAISSLDQSITNIQDFYRTELPRLNRLAEESLTNLATAQLEEQPSVANATNLEALGAIPPRSGSGLAGAGIGAPIIGAVPTQENNLGIETPETKQAQAQESQASAAAGGIDLSEAPARITPAIKDLAAAVQNLPEADRAKFLTGLSPQVRRSIDLLLTPSDGVSRIDMSEATSPLERKSGGTADQILADQMAASAMQPNQPIDTGVPALTIQQARREAGNDPSLEIRPHRSQPGKYEVVPSFEYGQQALENRAETARTARQVSSATQSAQANLEALAQQEGQVGEGQPGALPNFTAASDGYLKTMTRSKIKGIREGAKAEIARRAQAVSADTAARSEANQAAMDAERSSEVRTAREAAEPTQAERAVTPDQLGAGEMPSVVAKGIQTLARMLGKKVVFMRGMSADGMVKDASTIYLSTQQSMGPMAVFGHEFWHQIKMTHPEVWAAVAKVVRSQVTEDQMVTFFRDYYSNNEKLSAWSDDQIKSALMNKGAWTEGRVQLKEPLSDFLLEEMLSDLGGNRFTDTQFWTDVFAQLEAKEGHGRAKNLIRDLVQSITRMINNLLTLMKGNQQFAIESGLDEKQLNAIKSALTTAMADYLQDTRYGAQGQVQATQAVAAPKTVTATYTDEDGREQTFVTSADEENQAALDAERSSLRRVSPELNRQAEEFYKETGIRAYVPEEVVVPVEADETKFSPRRKGNNGQDPVTGLWLNGDGSVNLYLHTTNEEARRIQKQKTLKDDGSGRLILTDESSAFRVMAPGDEKRDLGGVVKVQVNPALLHILSENEDGSKTFFIPTQEGATFKAKMQLWALYQSRNTSIAPEATVANVTDEIARAMKEWEQADGKQRKILAKRAKDLLLREHNIGTLMTENGKLESTRDGEYGLKDREGRGVDSLGLGLAAAQKISDKWKSTCPQSASCEGVCLGDTAGGNMQYGGVASSDSGFSERSAFRSGPRMSQFLKTEAMLTHPYEFAIRMQVEIESLVKWDSKVNRPDKVSKTGAVTKYSPKGYSSAIRLNVTSDIPPSVWKALMEANPNVTFYDYTKLASERVAPNHHLTYSSTGVSQEVNGKTALNLHSNWAKMRARLDAGYNVAMAFSNSSHLPEFIHDAETGKTYRVWNGDNYDARYLDPKSEDGVGMIVGLKKKDATVKDAEAAFKVDQNTGSQGFFVHYQPSRKHSEVTIPGDTVVIQDQNKFADQIAAKKAEKSGRTLKGIPVKTVSPQGMEGRTGNQVLGSAQATRGLDQTLAPNAEERQSERRAVTYSEPIPLDDAALPGLAQQNITIGGKMVGFTTLLRVDGQPKVLAHIEIFDDLRGQGYAEDTVADLLSQTDELWVYNIQPDSVPFWKKIGVTLDEDANWNYGNGTLDEGRYRDNAQERRQARSEAGAEYQAGQDESADAAQGNDLDFTGRYSESRVQLDPHESFWQGIESGKNEWTGKEIVDAFGIGRRGTVRKGVAQDARRDRAQSAVVGDGSGSEAEADPNGRNGADERGVRTGTFTSPGAAQAMVHWLEPVAGFRAYDSSAEPMGSDRLAVFFYPGDQFADRKRLHTKAFATYVFTEQPDGRFRLDINGPEDNYPVAELLKANRRWQVANESYNRVKFDSRYTTSRAWLQEAVRRLALHTGQVPTVYQAGRDTGARTDSTEERTYGPDTIRGRFSERRQPWYYSALEQGVRGAKLQTQPATQWKLWLNSNAAKLGIKKDELEWSGVLDYLDMRGKDRITATELGDWVAGNNVVVQDVVLGDRENMYEFALRKGMTPDKAEQVRILADQGDFEAKSVVEAYPLERIEPKFSQYVLPGGENYKELLITLPGKTAYQTPNGAVFTEEDLSNPVVRRTAEKIGLSKVSEVKFRSSHFDQPNILAHIRMNERTDADGKRVLFLEELQSDWGQSYKKYGDKNTNDLETALRQVDKNAPSSAPFVTDTKSWTGLALKRAIAYAVDNGFDKIAWANGEQQAERYDLSKQIKAIMVMRTVNSKRYEVKAQGKDGSIVTHSTFEASELPDVVGKDLAEKIVANKNRMQEYKGLDLKVGGEGMKGYYDAIVPQVAKKLGAKVGVVEIDTRRPEDDAWYEELTDADILKQPGFEITDAMRGPMPLFSEKRITVDGIERPTTNSNGKPIHPTEEGIRNFWRWFGDSKVVDADGKPLVVYHGTNADFNVFKSSNIGTMGPGIYFTFDRSHAEEWARRYKGGRVVEAYLHAENPVEISNTGEASQLYERFAPNGSDREMVLGLRQEGHDAAWATGRAESKFGTLQPEIAVYDPTQIKSATGNTGAFDGANPDIRYSPARVAKVLTEEAAPAPEPIATEREWNAIFKGRKFQTPIEQVKMGPNQFYKLVGNKRQRFTGMVAPTLAEPLFVYQDADGSHVYVKSFNEGNGLKTFVSVAVNLDETYVVISNGVRDMMPIARKVSDADEAGRLLKTGHAAGHPSVAATTPEEQPSLAGGLDQTIARQSERRIIGDSGRTYTPAQRKLFENVGRDVEQLTAVERIREWANKNWAQGLVDQFAPVKQLSQKAYALMRLSKGATGAFEAFMHHGKLSLRDGAYDADTSGGVIETVFNPLGKETTDFLYWMAGHRADSLKNEWTVTYKDGTSLIFAGQSAAQAEMMRNPGSKAAHTPRENLFTPGDIKAAKSLADGDLDFDYVLANGTTTRSRQAAYKDSQAKFSTFNKNVLDMAEQSGLIDKASRAHWEHEFYVPFYRVADMTDGGVRGMNIKQGVVRQQAFKKLKGGKDKLNDLLENTLMNWSHLIDASAKNRAAVATLEAAKAHGIATRLAYKSHHKAGDVWAMEKGEQVWYSVDDQYLLTALNGLEFAGMRGGIMDTLSTAKHWLTVGVTASPFFKVRNLIRDSISAIGVSPLGANPLANIKQGFELSARDRQEYVSALAGGGLIRFGTMMEGNEAARTRKLIKLGAKDANILNNEGKVRAFLDKLEPALTAYNELGNRGEEINRMALYDQLIKQGMDHATASLMARDLLDFSMQGAWTSVRFLTQVVPFLNARLQGMYKLGRAAKEEPARMAAVTFSVALAGLALMAYAASDDDRWKKWKKREEWDKDNYFYFSLGGMEFRIPRPFEIGAVASIAERTVETAFLDNERDKWKRLGHAVMKVATDQLAMNPVPQLIKPVVDIYANKNSFTGRPIETLSMQRLDPKERYTASTWMPARAASAAIGGALSPVQIESLVRGYFSWMGATAVGTADIMMRSVNDEPTKPALDYWKFATGGMVADADSAASRYVSQVYEQAAELERAHATYKRLMKEGRLEEANEYKEDNADKLRSYGRTEAVKKQLQKLNERIRVIERSDKHPAEKRILINRIRQQESDLAAKLAA